MTTPNQDRENARTPSVRRRVTASALALLALIGGAVAINGAAGSGPASANHHKVRTIEVDVAEDGTRFVIDEKPVFDDGSPAYGNPFITQGYLYPVGTLTKSNGVNPDGTPEFPDRVIGEWTCTGYFIADGAHTTEGSWVYTTQLFAFGDDPDSGAHTIVVTGYESGIPGTTVTGAITGGTGRHESVLGESDQTFLGMNNPDLATMGINKTVELHVSKR